LVFHSLNIYLHSGHVDVADSHKHLVGIQSFMEMTWSFAVAVAITVGLVEVAKTIGLTTKYAPLASLVIGVGASFLFPAATVALTILFGVIVGLTACGLYSGAKATIQN
jgi:hypothetical protein